MTLQNGSLLFTDLFFSKFHPGATFSTISAPGCPRTHIFPMDFNYFELSPISLILHRCSGATNPMVPRTLRLCAAQNNYVSQWILNNSACYSSASFQNIAPTIGFSNICDLVHNSNEYCDPLRLTQLSRI